VLLYQRSLKGETLGEEIKDELVEGGREIKKVLQDPSSVVKSVEHPK